jgi:hypothetical protein
VKSQSKPAAPKRLPIWPLKRRCSDQWILRFVRKLHRGQNAYITFHRKTNDRFKNLFSILSKRIGSFSARLQRRRQDAFFSINGFWRPELEDENPPPRIKNVWSRKTKHVHYLNAVYSDIDCYNTRLDPDEALEEIGKLIEAGRIPTPSCGLFSRGLWLFWLLRDRREPNRPPRAGKKINFLYHEVMLNIQKTLASVGADSGATDASRTTRVPGSKNSRSGQTVCVLWPPRGQPPTFTLTRLLRHFKPEAAQPKKTERERPREVPDRHSPLRPKTNDNGWTRVNRQRVRQFRLLEKLRDGFEKGCRNKAAMIYARLLKTRQANPLGELSMNIEQKLARFGARCRPPLTAPEVRGAVQSGTSKRRGSIRNKTISEWLGITLTEHEALKERFGRYAWRPSPINSVPRPAEARREAIRKIVGTDEPLSIREMTRMLREKGHDVSPTQVAKDYRALGYNYRGKRWIK